MKPHLTEKSYQLTTQAKPVFTFLVKPGDSAAVITAIIRDCYNKEVTGVRLVKNAGKLVKRRGIKGKTARRVKALVTLKKGQTIEAFAIDVKKDKKDKKDSR